MLPILTLKKDEDRRLRAGHLWVYSNEIATLPQVAPGESVLVQSSQGRNLGVATINPHSLITARIFSHDVQDRLDVDFLVRRLKTALRGRMQLFSEPFYRLCFAEGDWLPGLIVDRYGPHLVVQITTAAMDAIKPLIIDALKTVLAPESILFRNDSSARLLEGLPQEVSAAWGAPPETAQVIENGVVFEISLWKGQKTGWFYDHRLNRARLSSYVAKKRVLDIFSYIGGWAVQAACAGASEVCAIDSSAPALALLQRNAAQQNVTITTMEGDAFEQLALLPETSFDVVILDPPAFIKKRKDIPAGIAAYQRLHDMAIKRVAPGGILISASCSLHLSIEDLRNILRKSSVKSGRALQIIEQGHQGPDHPIHPAIPETEYLKCFFTRVL